MTETRASATCEGCGKRGAGIVMREKVNPVNYAVARKLLCGWCADELGFVLPIGSGYRRPTRVLGIRR